MNQDESDKHAASCREQENCGSAAKCVWRHAKKAQVVARCPLCPVVVLCCAALCCPVLSLHLRRRPGAGGAA